MTRQEYNKLYADYLDLREKYMTAVRSGKRTIEYKGVSTPVETIYEWLEAHRRILEETMI